MPGQNGLQQIATIMKPEFRKARHSIIVSDIHLSDAEIPNPRRPFWKRFKQREFFIDDSFSRFLLHIETLTRDYDAEHGIHPSLPETSASPIELILNGDIFDFDAVMELPEDTSPTTGSSRVGHVSWLERARGLSAEEAKSRFKMEVILRDHAVWVNSLGEFIKRGHHAVFVIGNHDMELHWPGVQQAIVQALGLTSDQRENVRFCEWFYISNHDTLIEHGNQYDSYSICTNPIHPLIRKGTKITVRLPFGDIANKYMINGMGLFNPYVTSQFIMSFFEYMKFFFKFMLRDQPLLLWTWFWGAMMTLAHSLAEGFLPAIKDPLTVERRIAEIAQKSNASPRLVRSLKEVHVHPVYYNPLKIMRELWLDRALLFGLMLFGSWEIVSLLKLIANISTAWMIVGIAIFMPFFVFYARSIRSQVKTEVEQAPAQFVALSARLARVKRVVHGHTHNETHTQIEGIELLNTGTWSPAFHDIQCTKPYGRKPFAWLKPSPIDRERSAELREWQEHQSQVIAPSVPLSIPATTG